MVGYHKAIEASNHRVFVRILYLVVHLLPSSMVLFVGGFC